MRESDYIYTAADGTCHSSDYEGIYILKGYNMLVKGCATLMGHIKDGPVSISLAADSHVFQYYTGGILNSELCGTTTLNHAVLAVGYGLVGEQPYYLVKNSWGASWGDEGYIKLEITDGAGICGINYGEGRRPYM